MVIDIVSFLFFLSLSLHLSWRIFLRMELVFLAVFPATFLCFFLAFLGLHFWGFSFCMPLEMSGHLWGLSLTFPYFWLALG
jgi:hypothetical protein